MNHRRPLFSIVMPVYNAARYLESAIAGIQAQTIPDWELVIVDDASTDESAQMAHAFARDDQRIRVVSHDVNKGAPSARNTGIEAARGLYLWLPDPDDEYAPDLLESCACALAENPAVITVFGLIEIILDEQGNVARECVVSMPDARCIMPDETHRLVMPLEASTLLGYSANKVYDADFLAASGVKWGEEPIIEDFFFNIGLFQVAPSLNVLAYAPYRYFRRAAVSLSSAFVADYYPLHRKRIAVMRDCLAQWGLLDDQAKARLGARFARYILSAAERSFDERSHMNADDRLVWINSVFEDELFCELMPHAHADGLASNVCIAPLKARRTRAVLALGRAAHEVRTRGSVAYRIAVKRS